MRVLVTLKEGGDWYRCETLEDAIDGAERGAYAAVSIGGVVFDPILMRAGEWPWRMQRAFPLDSGPVPDGAN